jgi:hypothetical protein
MRALVASSPSAAIDLTMAVRFLTAVELANGAPSTGGSGGGLTLGGDPLQAFEVAGMDGRFVAAVSVDIVDGNRVSLHAPTITRPAFVRYAWRAYPTGWLLNADGLPAAPFSRRIE